jgi:ABC-type polysaccharide/polyol phosphate export permease
MTRRSFDELRELWRYRSLLRMLVERDLKTRYRGSALGVLWSFLQPLGMMLVMSALAWNIKTNRINGVVYDNWHVFVLCGLLAWNFFSAAVVGGSGSVLDNAHLVKKVYFPRIVLPLAAVISALINYLLALPVFLAVALLSGHPLTPVLLFLPFVVLIQTVFSAGIAMLLSTLNVFYRDTKFILELAMLALFFLTPIFYSAEDLTLPAAAADSTAVWVRRLNPMASLVNMYQDLMFLNRMTSLDFVLRTALTAALVFVVGYFAFQRYGPRFGEEV